MKKKGIHSIGTLLIFIAMLIITVIIASVFLTTGDKLANHPLAKGVINENLNSIEILEVAGYDARTQSLTTLTVDIRLKQNQDRVNLDNVLLQVFQSNAQSSLVYDSALIKENSNQGYNTWSEEEFERLESAASIQPFIIDAITESTPYVMQIDLDDDGQNDSLVTCDGTGNFCPPSYDGNYVMIDLTTTTTDYFVELRNQDNTLGDISSTPETLNVVKQEIGDYGSISIVGTVTSDYRIGYNNEIVTLYKQPELIDADLDDDHQDDYFYINATHVMFVLSTLSNEIIIPMEADISSPPTSVSLTKKIVNAGVTYGTLDISASISTSNVIDADDTFSIRATRDGAGHYFAEYISEGPHHIEGFINSGDIVRLYAEFYSPVNANDEIAVALVSNRAQYARTSIFVGHTIPNAQRYVMYPQIANKLS